MLLYTFNNLYIIKGEVTLFTLNTINTYSAYFVVISTLNIDSCLNGDSEAILTAKILEEYFQVNYIIEIQNDKNLNFISQSTYLNDFVISERLVKNKHLNTSFSQGKILLSSLDSLIFNSNKNLIVSFCIKTLIQTDFYELSNNFDNMFNLNLNKSQKTIINNVSHEIDISTDKYSPWINSIHISSENDCLGRKYYEVWENMIESNLIPRNILLSR